ncbi:uncharacterized protein LOC143281714 [Babylonia areolata]|uniref:uncharacterized protein LOC143281714 n=1 Tax=Babylonia areolata TaxID=304850 RepID=UPI003FD5DD2A
MAGCQCGFGAHCVGGNCTCLAGLTLHPNGRDCKNDTCTDPDCLTCSVANTCVRCVKFILSGDGRCEDICSGYAEVRTEGPLQGNVCIPQEDESSDNKLIIGIAAGVGAGLLLCFIAIVIVCIYIRRTRKKVSLQSQQYKSPDMGKGNIIQYPAYDNEAYDEDMNRGVKSGVIDPAVYAMQLEQLRPFKDTLMTLLGQIRPKLRAMSADDPRVPTYKGVVHQLCRVLVLLHRDDTGSSIPSDALGLIEWAHQMLEDHRQQQELQSDAVSPDVLGDLGHNRISYIDMDTDAERQRTSAVYAEPMGSSSFSKPPSSAGGVNPYSSVPVPVSPQDSTFPRTFATIHRTPSVPGTVNNNGKGIYARPTVGHQTSESHKSKNTPVGYFANGRYYDPNPNPQGEVYAPASSYSDRSTAPLSTFMPDRPRSRSLSSSGSSSGEAVDGEECSEGDGDMFPFDPKDATEPVEV